VTRSVEELLARKLDAMNALPVYVYGSTPAYYVDGTETGKEDVLLHERAIAEHANRQRREELLAAAEREAAQPPGRAYFEQAFALIHERLEAVERVVARDRTDART
jgi:hypothetical protein